MSEEQRVTTANELGGDIMQLRAFESNYIGAADRGPVLVGTYATEDAGPFDNEEQFNEYIISRMPPKLPIPFEQGLGRHWVQITKLFSHTVTSRLAISWSTGTYHWDPGLGICGTLPRIVGERQGLSVLVRCPGLGEVAIDSTPARLSGVSCNGFYFSSVTIEKRISMILVKIHRR